MKLTKIKFKDLISSLKWKAFIIGTYYSYIKPGLFKIYGWFEYPILTALGESQGKRISEVDRAFFIVYRHLSCPECMKAGFCDGCGCTTPGNILPENNTCHKKRWFTMVPDFFNFAKKNNFEIRIIPIPKKKIQDLTEEEFNKIINQ